MKYLFPDRLNPFEWVKESYMGQCFSKKMIGLSTKIIETEHKKRFLQELTKGTLPEEKFVYYLKQDYPYLIKYSRALALGVAKADTIENMRLMTDILQGIIVTEMKLHEEYAARFNISPKELAGTQTCPTKLAYGNHILSSSYGGNFFDIIAAILPCNWTYWKLAETLSPFVVKEGNPYLDWFETYTSDEYKRTVDICIELIDNQADDTTESQKIKAEKIYVQAHKLQLQGWDAYYSMEDWPV
jgi:thiaminase (transcriptional activator TenA)